MVTHKLRENLIECEHERIHCRLCGETFANGALLFQHIEMHLQERPFDVITQSICLICEHTCGKPKGLLQHLLKTHAITSDQLRMRSMALKVINANVASDYQVIESMLKYCQFCDVTFDTFKRMREHQLRTHSELVSVNELDKRQLCPQCGSSFSSPFTLSVHFRQNHRGKYLCSICCERLSVEDLYGVRAHYELHRDERLTSSASKRPRKAL